MQYLTYEGERGVVGVEGAHEAELYGVARGGVGGLDVGKIVQGEATTLIESYAAACDVIGRWLGLEDDGLPLLLDECLDGFGAIALRAQIWVDGEVLDVDELLEVPCGEQAEEVFLCCV